MRTAPLSFRPRRRIATAFAIAASFCLASFAAHAGLGPLSSNTGYTQERISDNPVRIRYTLQGSTDRNAAWIRENILGGAGHTFYFGRGDISTGSAFAFIPAGDHGIYGWAFNAVDFVDANGRRIRITGNDGGAYSLSFMPDSENQHYTISASFIAEYEKGIDPETDGLKSILYTYYTQNVPSSEEYVDEFHRVNP